MEGKPGFDYNRNRDRDEKEERPEAVGFAVQTGNKGRFGPPQYRERDVTCSHCGKYGHELSDCFQIKGYPEWWGERGRNFGEKRGKNFGGRGGGARGRFGRGGGIVESSGRGREGMMARANVAHLHPEDHETHQHVEKGDMIVVLFHN
ncbi:unnamed protein product [Arabis nemorensis]|uniref:CCHC-type domain-containing protein n=1 Tax=Arabis nemorensis TaxID=586526 RepID=A0A565BTH0_9BRAS|nr:unnamed protein product [Arabis nemorensis]